MVADLEPSLGIYRTIPFRCNSFDFGFAGSTLGIYISDSARGTPVVVLQRCDTWVCPCWE